jgi:hypothetical protein
MSACYCCTHVSLVCWKAGALQLALQLQLQHTQLLGLLLQPSQAGLYLYHTFPRLLHAWFIFNAEQLLPPVLTALAAPAAAAAAAEGPAGESSTYRDTSSAAAAAAEVLLVGSLESLGSSGGIRTGAFLTSLFKCKWRDVTWQ